MRIPDGFQKIPGLSICPIEWKVVQADEICSKITKGTTPPKSDIVEDRDIPFLRVNNLTFEGRLNETNNLLFVSESAHRSSLARSIAYPKDILMNIVGPPLGKVVLLPETFAEYNLNQAIIIYRLDPGKTNIPYFLNYLKSSYAQYWLSLRSKKTSGQQNLTIDQCKEPPVPPPSLPEQQKIAHILSSWDKAIEKLESLIVAKQKRKKALMQQLLTGKKRFPGFEGEWKEIHLKRIISEVKLRNKNSLVTRVLSVTNRNGFVLPAEQFSRQVASDDLSNYKIIRRGQFGYNPSRINVGSFARLNRYDEGLLSPMYVIFSINEKVLDSDFFLNWMSSHEAKQRISSSTQGTVRDSVVFDALSSFLINLPPIEEQQKIASILSAANSEITIQKKQLNALKQQKKGLMHQLLTGKKRVKLDEPEQLAAVGA